VDTRENELRDNYKLMVCNDEGNGAYRVAESRFPIDALAERGSRYGPPIRQQPGLCGVILEIQIIS